MPQTFSTKRCDYEIGKGLRRKFSKLDPWTWTIVWVLPEGEVEWLEKGNRETFGTTVNSINNKI